MCGDTRALESGHDGEWGEWTEWVGCPAGMAIDGMQVQIEPDQTGPDGDDTGMNGIKFTCSQIEGMTLSNTTILSLFVRFETASG